MSATTPYRGMSPVEIVHLYLHEVPVVFILMVEQPIECAHIPMIGESQMTYTSGLSLFEEVIEEVIVKETAFEVVHPSPTDAMQEVVVDVIDFQSFKRPEVHLFGLVEVPHIGSLIGHFGGDIEFLSWMTSQRIACEFLRPAPHIHGSSIKIIDTMSDGVIHHLIDLVLIVRQSHHAKSQQRHLYVAAMLHSVGHTDGLIVFSCEEKRPIDLTGKGVEWFQCHHSDSRPCSYSQSPQKRAAPEVCIILFFHFQDIFIIMFSIK